MQKVFGLLKFKPRWKIRRGRLARRESFTGFAFVLPSLLGFLAFYLGPMFFLIQAAFTKPFGGGFAGLSNFSEVWSSPSFRLGAWNTIRFIAISVPLMITLSFLLALALHKRQKTAMRTWIILPLVIPTASVAQFFFVLFAEQGLTNRVLQYFSFSKNIKRKFGVG